MLIILFLQLPTPIHKWNLPNLPNKTEVWLKVLSVSFFLFFPPNLGMFLFETCLKTLVIRIKKNCLME